MTTPSTIPTSAIPPTSASVLVLGGSGAVGQEITKLLTAAGARVVFTFWRRAEVAASLAASTGARAEHIDLRNPAEIRALVARLGSEGFHPTKLIHSAGLPSPVSLAATQDSDFADVLAVNTQAPFVAAHALIPHMIEAGGGDIVLLGALDRTQSLPLPVAFAASQGALPAMAMALGRELGSKGIRANVLAVGLLSSGLSMGLDPALVEDYKNFSAFRRLGDPAEVARVAVWLATQNTYVNGKVISVNGGI